MSRRAAAEITIKAAPPPSRQSSLLRWAYVAMVSVFFGLCAFVNFNDPDAAPWMAMYIVGGPLISLSLVLPTLLPGTVMAPLCSMLVAFYCALCGYLFGRVTSSIDLGSLSPRAAAWALVEFEEGREMVGVGILLLHTVVVRSAASGHRTGQALKTVLWTVVSVIILISGTVGWMWQPAMNARYQTPHCKGAFDSLTGGNAAAKP